MVDEFGILPLLVRIIFWKPEKMKLLVFLICESLAGMKSGAGNLKVQEECNVNIRKSRAKLTHVGTSSQDSISSILIIRGKSSQQHKQKASSKGQNCAWKTEIRSWKLAFQTCGKTRSIQDFLYGVKKIVAMIFFETSMMEVLGKGS